MLNDVSASSTWKVVNSIPKQSFR